MLALLSAGLVQKFQAYLIYLSLIRNKNPRLVSFFSKIPPFYLYVAMVSPFHPQFSPANWWHAQSFFSSVCCHENTSVYFCCVRITAIIHHSKTADQATHSAQVNYLLFAIKQWSLVRSFQVYTVYCTCLQVGWEPDRISNASEQSYWCRKESFFVLPRPNMACPRALAWCHLSGRVLDVFL